MWGSGFRVQGSGCQVQGSGFRVSSSGFRFPGSGFRVQDLGFGGYPRRSNRTGTSTRDCYSESVAFSVGTPLCVYGIAYRRVQLMYLYGLFRESLHGTLCGWWTCANEVLQIVIRPVDELRLLFHRALRKDTRRSIEVS